MRQGKVYSLWQLICSETPQKIRIPQIQRDYVQYRSGHVETNLNRFVSSLTDALVNKHEINLNFVYGNVERAPDLKSKTFYDAFCPIDGQQRLTTLYLLHYYIFNEACDNVKQNMLRGKLIYLTRASTMDFLEALSDERNAIRFSASEETPEKLITESGWYTSLWDADPSVRSCLKVLNVIREKLREKLGDDLAKFQELAELLVSDNCPITFMKLELEKLDNPNELYIKMNSRGKQLTAFENFKSELFRIIKEKKSDYPEKFKANTDGDWLELIWELCNSSDKYTDIFYRDLFHVSFMNSLIAKLPKNDKEYIKVLDPYTRRFASTFYIEDYEKCFRECAGREEAEASIMPDLITRFYYTMECIYILSKDASDTFKEVTDKLFGIVKNNDASKLEDYRDNYIPHTLLEAVCVFANSNGAKAEADRGEYVSRFKAWWRVANNLITNTEIDDIHSFISSVRDLNTVRYSYFVEKYLGVLDDGDDRYIFLDSTLRSEQKKEEILKQKIINLGGKTWADAITEAEKNEYFNREINFALRLTGINRANDIRSLSAKNFSDTWKVIEEIFKDAEKNDILMHRALLTFGDYSKEISSYDSGKNRLSTYYSYSEKHHNQDWRGLLRDGRFDIFEKLFNDYKGSLHTTFADYANDAVKNYAPTQPYDLKHLLIKNEEMFKYTQSFRCWHYYGESRILKTSKRSAYYDCKLYEIYTAEKTNLSGLEIHEGTNNTKECYLSYKGKNYKVKGGVLYEENTHTKYLNVEYMIAYLHNV